MAYNPTVWEENDLLSADRMNKIEHGIAAASEPPDGLLPTGGTTGQMLTKASDNDFDAEWVDVPEGITMDEVNSAIESALPPKSDIFVEVYGLDLTDGETAKVSFSCPELLSASNTYNITNEDTVEYVLSKWNNRIDTEGATASFEKFTGRIIVTGQDGEQAYAMVTMSGEVITPYPQVSTFNGRSGIVKPQQGDYTAEMVGAIPNTDISNINVLTQAEYDALTATEDTTMYLIPEEE